MSLPSPVDLLRKLVSIESVFPNEQEVSAFISNLLIEHGFVVEQVMSDGNRPSLVASFGKSDRYLGFYGHMDTVPPASDYIRDPFSVAVEGDIARGLGVCDMKGGLTCILHAAVWAAAEGLPVKAIFGVDEENISQGANDLVRSGKLKDLAFLVVAESGQVVDFDQPLSVCLGRKGRVVVELLVRGKAAHAAEKEKGVNAIEKAAKLIDAISQFTFPSHKNLGETSVVVQGISGHSDAFSVPDECVITCSLLTTPGVTTSSFQEQLSSCAANLDIEVSLRTKSRATPYAEAFEVPKEDPFFKIIEQQILQPLGVTPMYTPSVADENFFAHGLRIPVLTVGAIGARDHTKDEWVSLSSLTRVIDAYRKMISLASESLSGPHAN